MSKKYSFLLLFDKEIYKKYFNKTTNNTNNFDSCMNREIKEFIINMRIFNKIIVIWNENSLMEYLKYKYFYVSDLQVLANCKACDEYKIYLNIINSNNILICLKDINYETRFYNVFENIKNFHNGPKVISKSEVKNI